MQTHEFQPQAPETGPGHVHTVQWVPNLQTNPQFLPQNPQTYPPPDHSIQPPRYQPQQVPAEPVTGQPAQYWIPNLQTNPPPPPMLIQNQTQDQQTNPPMSSFQNQTQQQQFVPMNYQTQAASQQFPAAMVGQYPQQMQVPIQLHNSTHVVVMQQQQQQQQQQQTAAYVGYVGPEAWTTGIFDCLEDPFNALVTLAFPCLTFGQVAEIVDNGNSSCVINAILYSGIYFLIGLPCIISCVYRSKLRSKYNLAEYPLADWATHLCCEYCALCQEYRELSNRGFDPFIGWNANVRKNQAQQHHQAAMAAPRSQTMTG